ncbi:hypothetical protein L1887_57352 [Cichorium endivia]|nr:hypothetical protein L1887_57352 [Cichorium endivia]
MRDICTTAQRRADMQVHWVVETAMTVFNADREHAAKSEKKPNSAAWAADPDTLFERCDESQAQQKHHAAPDLLMHPPPPRRQRSFRHTLPHVGWLKDGWHPLRLGRLTDGSIRPYDPSSCGKDRIGKASHANACTVEGKDMAPAEEACAGFLPNAVIGPKGNSAVGASLGRQMVSRCSPTVAKLAATCSPASRVGRLRWLAPNAWVTTSGGVETSFASQHGGARAPRRRLDAGIDFQLRRPTQNRLTVQTKRSASRPAQSPRRRRGPSPERRALLSRPRPPDSLRHRPTPSRLASLRTPRLTSSSAATVEKACLSWPLAMHLDCRHLRMLRLFGADFFQWLSI